MIWRPRRLVAIGGGQTVAEVGVADVDVDTGADIAAELPRGSTGGAGVFFVALNASAEDFGREGEEAEGDVRELRGGGSDVWCAVGVICDPQYG
jgi:hypothetical protein